MGMFNQARREKLKLRMAICGPAKSGKSWNGLMFCEVLAKAYGQGQPLKIAAIDTESGSLRKHMGDAITLPFDV